MGDEGFHVCFHARRSASDGVRVCVHVGLGVGAGEDSRAKGSKHIQGHREQMRPKAKQGVSQPPEPHTHRHPPPNTDSDASPCPRRPRQLALTSSVCALRLPCWSTALAWFGASGMCLFPVFLLFRGVDKSFWCPCSQGGCRHSNHGGGGHMEKNKRLVCVSLSEGYSSLTLSKNQSIVPSTSLKNKNPASSPHLGVRNQVLCAFSRNLKSLSTPPHPNRPPVHVQSSIFSLAAASGVTTTTRKPPSSSHSPGRGGPAYLQMPTTRKSPGRKAPPRPGHPA